MIQIRYTPTFKDYWALNRQVLRKRIRNLTVMAVALVAAYAISPWFPYSDTMTLPERYWNNSAILILPALIILVWWSTYRGAKKRWAVAGELREERRYEIDETGIRVKGDNFEAFEQWSLTTQATITPQFVYLMTAQQQYHYFPVSVVPDLAQLKVLMEQKVPVKLVK